MHDLFKNIVDDFTSLPAKVAAATKASDGNPGTADLTKSLRAEANKIANVRIELRECETDRDERLARDLNNAAEWPRVLARLVEGKSIHEAFGAPGDFGYDTPIGAALSCYYSAGNAQPDYRQALADLVAFVERMRDNSNGRWPEPDMNCGICSQGVSQTGEVCVYHRAKRLVKS